MFKRIKGLIIGAILFLCTLAAFSVPQLAVLNAVLAKGIDPTVVAPVTDKIIEELVRSGRYMVLDRTNVEQILQEKEFQLSSGIVRNEEIRQAGEYLGADFVVVANVTRVGGTYVISGKMIDVVSGEIAAQVSAEKEGKIDVLLDVAREVGRRLATGERGEVVAEKKAEEKKEVAEKATADSSAVLQLQALIKNRVFLKPAGRDQMLNLAAELPEKERFSLYSSHTRDDAVMGLLLNLLLLSLGSWIQTDYIGALWQLGLGLVGATLFVSAYDYTLAGAGALIYAGGVVYGIVRPFTWVKLWNQNLARALDVQVSLLEGDPATFAFIPPDEGSSWRLAVSLVSVRY